MTWLASLPRAAQASLPVALGALAALGQSPQSLWIATLLALGGLFALFPAAGTPGRAALWLWLFGTAHFAVALRWLVEPFQVEADIYGWMAPFALALMAGGLALFWAGAGWLAFWLGRDSGGRAIVALVLALAAAEIARGYLFTGFPWAGFAQTWVEYGLAQTLAWWGPHGLGLLTLALAALPVALRGPRRFLALAGSAAIVALGLVLQPTEPSATDGAVVRIVQPNAPQQEKWAPERAQVFFRRQIEATAAGAVPDLVVWPETAIPTFLRHADDTLAVIAKAARGAPVAMGVMRDDGRRAYNSLVVVGPGGEITATYDKHHLVPFGEYMPLPWLFRGLGIRGLAERADTGFARGPGPEVIDLDGLRALPLICYEAVFPRNVRVDGPRPDLLLQVTNDAWFGVHAGPQQHLAQARMRAIEQGLPLVRSANTGISALIDPRGRVVASLPLGTHGFVDGALPTALAATLYARTGDVPVAVLILLGLSCLGWVALMSNRG